MGFKFWGQEEQITQVLVTGDNPALQSASTHKVRTQHHLMVIGLTYIPYYRILSPIHMRFLTELIP